MEKYFCEKCDYSTPHGLYFDRHLQGLWHKSGSGPKPVFTCEVCNWRTSQGKRIYEKHLESPTHKYGLHVAEVKKTGYYCELCSYETMDKSNFDRHIRCDKHQKKEDAKRIAECTLPRVTISIFCCNIF